MQTGEIANRRFDLGIVRTTNLIPLHGGGEIFEKQGKRRVVSRNRAVQAFWYSDRNVSREPRVEESLGAIAATSARGSTLLARRRKFPNDRARTGSWAFFILEENPFVMRHLAGTHRLAPNRLDMDVETTLTKHTRQPFGREIFGIVDDGGC